MRKLKVILIFIIYFSFIVSCSAQIINTIVGIHYPGYNGDGGPAISSELNIPNGVAFDTTGNLYIADYANRRIRMVAKSTGIISTVAGSGYGGLSPYSGDGGPATDAELDDPIGVSFDSSGNMYISDAGNNVIREVNVITGIISTVVGNGYGSGGNRGGYTGDGGQATSAELAGGGVPSFDKYGNMFLPDGSNNVIREVNGVTGIITTVAGNGYGHVIPMSYYGGYTGDGGPATSSELYGPSSVALDDSANLYIADFFNCAVRKVSILTGIITTFAGGKTNTDINDGICATLAKIAAPSDLKFDKLGNLYIACIYMQQVRLVDKTNTITTLTGIYNIAGFSGDSGPAMDAELNDPSGLAFDAIGNLYIADQGNNVIREVTMPTGIKPLTQTNTIKVYPNPTKGVITFEFNKLINGFIDLFDIKGGLVLHKQISNSVESIDCSGLTDSVYLYKVTDEKGNIAGEGKVVIEK